jgi:hypothetical protein
MMLFRGALIPFASLEGHFKFFGWDPGFASILFQGKCNNPKQFALATTAQPEVVFWNAYIFNKIKL